MIIIPFNIYLNTEVNMKTKIYTLLIVTGLLLAACAPAAVMEAEPVVAEQPTEAVVAPEPTAEPAPTAAPTEAGYGC